MGSISVSVGGGAGKVSSVTVGNPVTTTVKKGTQGYSAKQVAITAKADASEIDRLSELTDVDASDSDNNEVLVYNSANNKYEIKVLPTVDGGDF